VRHWLLDASASFIQKPFTTKELAERLRAVLDSRTPRR
jgi:DNA-binding response OmpR family regulator